MTTCNINGCSKKAVAWGFCDTDYRKLRRAGDSRVKARRKFSSAEQRFYASTEVGDTWFNGTPCIEWQAGCSAGGYGQIRDDTGKLDYTHRWAYKRWVGEIPDLPGGKTSPLDHGCENKVCCSYLHVMPVTHHWNSVELCETSAAAINARRTHCQRGHEFTEANTRWITSSMSGRRTRLCRECVRIRGRKNLPAYRARLKTRGIKRRNYRK